MIGKLVKTVAVSILCLGIASPALACDKRPPPNYVTYECRDGVLYEVGHWTDPGRRRAARGRGRRHHGDVHDAEREAGDDAERDPERRGLDDVAHHSMTPRSTSLVASMMMSQRLALPFGPTALIWWGPGSSR